jgi:predicted nucleic acid-binding protein
VNVVDTSAWLEYLDDGPNASVFAPAIEAHEELVVPTLALYEVFKRVTQLTDEGTALNAVGTMLRGTIVDLSSTLALEAARLSLASRLAMADAVILATARTYRATLWTQDAHFAGIEGVRYVAKP